MCRTRSESHTLSFVRYEPIATIHVCPIQNRLIDKAQGFRNILPVSKNINSKGMDDQVCPVVERCYRCRYCTQPVPVQPGSWPRLIRRSSVNTGTLLCGFDMPLATLPHRHLYLSASIKFPSFFCASALYTLKSPFHSSACVRWLMNSVDKKQGQRDPWFEST
jgi:hypothetical protein